MAEIDILPLVPDQYDSSAQIMRHAEIVPAFALPSDKIFILGKGKEWTKDQVFNVGQTQLRHNDMSGIDAGTKTALQNAGKTYHSVPFTPQYIGLPATDILGDPAQGPNQWNGSYPDLYNSIYFPNGLPTYDQGYQLGLRCNIDDMISVAETMENLHYTNPRAEFWRGFYDARTPRLIARFGQNYKQSHDYLFIQIGPDWHYISETQAKNYFRNLPSLPNYDFTTGSLKHCNLYVGDGYPGPMNRDNRIIYAIALKARMYQALGKSYCVLPTMEREWMPNMLNAVKVPTGTLYAQGKMPFPAPLMAAVTMAGLHFGTGLIGWNASGKTTNKVFYPEYMEDYSNGSIYVKNGESQVRNWREVPNQTDVVTDNYKWSANEDYATFAARNYAATMGQTSGGTVKAVNFQINNGPVINALNTFQDDLCRAKYTQGPIVETVKDDDGLEALYFADPCGGSQKKTVKVWGQTGQVKTFEACGTQAHVCLWNI